VPTVTATPTTGPDTVVLVPLPDGPYSLDVNPNNGRLYVARTNASDVAILDLATLGWITNRPLPEVPYVVRVNPNLGRGYAAWGNPLYVFSCADNSMAGEIATGPIGISELAVNPTNHRVYVGDTAVFLNQQDKVVVYDGTNNGLVGSVDLGLSPQYESIGLAVNRSTGLAYAAYSGDDKIAIINSNATLAGRITPSQMAQWPGAPLLALNSVANRLYLLGESETVVIDLNSNTEVGTLSHRGQLAVDETRNRIYVQENDHLYVYDGVTNASLREVDLGGSYYITDMRYDPGTRRVLMADPYENLIVYVTD
jgi:DNA-binding beta-propeller fold protein YncE